MAPLQLQNLRQVARNKFVSTTPSALSSLFRLYSDELGNKVAIMLHMGPSGTTHGLNVPKTLQR
jgi:hypothetical protein